jgi:hypothetical protein
MLMLVLMVDHHGCFVFYFVLKKSLEVTHFLGDFADGGGGVWWEIWKAPSIYKSSLREREKLCVNWMYLELFLDSAFFLVGLTNSEFEINTFLLLLDLLPFFLFLFFLLHELLNLNHFLFYFFI